MTADVREADSPGDRVSASIQSRSATLIFLHIHKTAGISIKSSLVKLFDPDVICDNLDMPSLRKQTSIGLIISHERLANLEKLGGAKVYITCLRNPADRLLSMYNFWNSVQEDYIANIGSGVLAEVRKLSFSEFICCDSEALTPYLDNEMTRTFCDATGILTEEDFDLACHNLRKIDSILFLETLTADLERFYHQIGCAARFEAPRVENKTSENFLTHPRHFQQRAMASLADLTETARERLLERTYLDRRLYDFARSMREAKGHRPLERADMLAIRHARLCRGDTVLPSETDEFARLLGTGWTRDRDPQWSVGPQSRLSFAVVGGTADPAFVELQISALLFANRNCMIVDVRVDDGERRRVLFADAVSVDLAEPRFHGITDICAGLDRTWTLRAPLHADADERRIHVIELQNAGVSSPALLGYNHDDRNLAVRLEKISIV